MVRRRYIFALSFLCLPAVIAYAAPSPIAAQAPSNTTPGQALEIAPPLITLSANPGQTIKTEISLRNISTSNLVVKGQVNDFEAAGEDGTPKIIFEETDRENPYSLKKWVSLPPNVNTTPRQIKKLPLTIKVPLNASPGGYYGVVRFTGTPPELEDTGVSLSASVGSLVLLTVNGQAKQKMSIADFSVTKDGKKDSLFETAPVDFVLKMKNEGNILEQPAGQAEITDMFGNRVAMLSFNQPPRYVLPGSTRKFGAPLDHTVIGNKILFGRYTAELKMTYGTDKKPVTASVTFWVIPYRFIAMAITGLVASFFLLRFALKRYNQSVIKRAQGSSGTPKSKRK